MIRSVKFKNFYSFRDEQSISFLAKKKDTYDYYYSKSGDQISKIIGFIGGNASGKTNIMRLFSFLSYFICMSSKEDPTLAMNTGFKTFFGNEDPSSFSLEFELNGSVFEYQLEIIKNIVNKEKLTIKGLQPAAKKVTIFSRDIGIKFKLNDAYFEGFKLNFIKNIRPDVSFIAFLKAHYNIKIINDVFNYFDNFRTNINERGELNNGMHQIKILKMYLTDPELKKSVEEFISNFDLGLNSFDIKSKTESIGTTISIEGIHTTGTEIKRLDFNYESRGTQSLFFTLANIFSALKHNNVVIIDEIEMGLHPEALSKLISYFIDENSNKKAQIIFSSHSLGFMNKFDMHQIFFSEKDKDNISHVYRLNEVKEIRSDENFLAKYMAGAYGAFPQIRV